MKRTIATTIALIATSSAHALSVAAYQDMQAQSLRSETTSLTLMAYRQSASELVDVLRTGKQNSSYLSKSWNICIPSGVALSDEVISAAIDVGLKNEKLNIKILGSDWKETKVGLFVFTGLAQLFPCKATE